MPARPIRCAPATSDRIRCGGWHATALSAACTWRTVAPSSPAKTPEDNDCCDARGSKARWGHTARVVQQWSSSPRQVALHVAWYPGGCDFCAALHGVHARPHSRRLLARCRRRCASQSPSHARGHPTQQRSVSNAARRASPPCQRRVFPLCKPSICMWCAPHEWCTR